MAKRKLTTAQRRRAAERLARRDGVDVGSVTDVMIDAALDVGTLSLSDCGPASGGFDGGGAGFGGGSSYSGGCDSGGGW